MLRHAWCECMTNLFPSIIVFSLHLNIILYFIKLIYCTSVTHVPVYMFILTFTKCFSFHANIQISTCITCTYFFFNLGLYTGIYTCKAVTYKSYFLGTDSCSMQGSSKRNRALQDGRYEGPLRDSNLWPPNL